MAALRSHPCVMVLEGRRVAIRHRATINIVHGDDITLVRSERNATRIVTGDGEFRVREPLHAVLKRLAPVGMTQVHRSVAVNSRKVTGLVGRGQHRLVMRLNDGRSLAVGRTYQPRVKLLFTPAEVAE
jgi:DNA-binding LytR/AlgR family response regulator